MVSINIASLNIRLYDNISRNSQYLQIKRDTDADIMFKIRLK